MGNNIIFFNKDIKAIPEEDKNKLGIRGRRVVELAEMGLPVAPGFILDSELTMDIADVNLKQLLKSNISKLEKELGRKFGDAENPLLLKVVLSSDLNVPFFPSIHNIGLNDETLDGFAKLTDGAFAYGEYDFLLKSIGSKLLDIEKSEFTEPKTRAMPQVKSALEKNKAVLGDNFSQDVYDQLVMILKTAAEKYCDSEIDVDNSLSIMVQAMVYGNMGANSYSGTYYTRNIVTGENKLQGGFLKNAFDYGAKKPTDVLKIDKKYLTQLTKVGQQIEDKFKELRLVKFTIEEGALKIIEQREVDEKATQAHMRTLLDLNKRKVVDEEYIVKHMKPVQLNELLHPVIDNSTVKKTKTIKGGISGATGAAYGRVFFSTKKLLEEHRRATLHGGETNLILVMPASYAEDVKAIEISQGVITTEGGFSSHAPVVARSLGKIAMVQPEMKIRGNSFSISGVTVKEGDYVSMNVPYHEDPTLYLGKVGLIEPDFEKNGLFEFSNILEKFIGDFNVRVNADQSSEAELAKKMNAKGVGLCRTEHMFFNEKRIMKFREMILAPDEKIRRKALDTLKPMQRSDFYELLKIMEGNSVTIRLLDAPLHEFLPKSKESMDAFIKYMKTKNKSLKPTEIKMRCDELEEVNPMLGHRGCRVAVTYPEIYEMQCRAIFEAVCMLKKEGIDVKPEIMVPVVMSEQELKFVKNGKKIEGTTVKGIRDIKEEVMKEYGVDELSYKVGSMIELPAAALRATQIAQYAEFFSFGTNDLTQTTYGLSRDDVNSFFPDYNLYDLVKANPFKILGNEVKELVELASIRGRLTRPDIKLGLCGEHGADPVNIAFCIEAGLNYVSCSTYSIPLAKLAIAQYNLDKAGEE